MSIGKILGKHQEWQDIGIGIWFEALKMDKGWHREPKRHSIAAKKGHRRRKFHKEYILFFDDEYLAHSAKSKLQHFQIYGILIGDEIHFNNRIDLIEAKALLDKEGILSHYMY